jgi:glucokinase
MADAQLQELAQKLGTPGGQKLYQAARKRGIQVTKDQVRQYVRRQGQKQIFRPLLAAAGKTASESEQMRAQMDLIDLKFSASKGFKMVLVVVNVWNRMGFAIPIVDKSAESVANGLRTLLNDVKLNPKFIFSDAGNEWRGPVQTLLEEKGIVHRAKEKEDVNALAVLDRFIQTFKKRLGGEAVQ